MASHLIIGFVITIHLIFAISFFFDFQRNFVFCNDAGTMKTDKLLKYHYYQIHDDRDDDYNKNNNLFVFSAKCLPVNATSLPVLSNGQIGFVLFSDTIYVNGFYNGNKGLSHRARIPNYANLQLIECHSCSFCKTVVEQQSTSTMKLLRSPLNLIQYNCNENIKSNCNYMMNTKQGYFKVIAGKCGIYSGYKIEHYIYPHRFYNRAIINQVFITRTNYDDGIIKIKLAHSPGPDSSDIKFGEEKIFKLHEQYVVYGKCGRTIVREDKKIQKSLQKICILWTHVPEEITLDANKMRTSYKFVMTIEENLKEAKQEMMDVLKLSDIDLLISHTKIWKQFWNTTNIHTFGNKHLQKIIHSSIFSIASSLPSLTTNIPNKFFYGLSPTGLGRGGLNLEDYEGHNFWDTEMWMLPAILIQHHEWVKLLLQYRFEKLEAAKKYAKSMGYSGARFPWESALTGCEVTQPCCPLVAKNQIHITGDISFAIRLYISASNDTVWLKKEGCPLAMEIAKFWASRLTYNSNDDVYEINNVMGPDEDHESVPNNVYTNVIAKYALEYGHNISGFCEHFQINWKQMASKIKIIYDKDTNYHPQYEGYNIGEVIKQADTILLGYPLNFPMPNNETLLNDLNIYSKVTRVSGPAMTWSMYAINFMRLKYYERANNYFLKGYQNYVRPPFYIWHEVNNPLQLGASNFITGAGGFLQSIVNGYGGIQINLNSLEIQNPQLPIGTYSLKIGGIHYMGAKFNLNIKKFKIIIQFYELPNDAKLTISYNGRIKIIRKTTKCK